MEICKTDVALASDYLDFAVKQMAADTSSRMRNKCRLMRNLSNKLKLKIKQHEQTRTH